MFFFSYCFQLKIRSILVKNTKNGVSQFRGIFQTLLKVHYFTLVKGSDNIEQHAATTKHVFGSIVWENQHGCLQKESPAMKERTRTMKTNIVKFMLNCTCFCSNNKKKNSIQQLIYNSTINVRDQNLSFLVCPLDGNVKQTLR